MASSRRTRRRGRGGQTRADGGADDATLSKVLARILRHSTQELGKLQELLNEGHSLGPKASTSVPMASSRSTTSSAPPRFAPSTGSHIVASEFFSVLMRMLTPAQLAAGHTTAEMVAAVVRADPSRFELTERNGSALVRATYGHSLPVPQLDAQLAPNVPPADAVLIAAPASLPVVRVKYVPSLGVCTSIAVRNIGALCARIFPDATHSWRICMLSPAQTRRRYRSSLRLGHSSDRCDRSNYGTPHPVRSHTRAVVCMQALAHRCASQRHQAEGCVV